MSMRDELEANFGVKVSRNLDLRRAQTGAGAADYVIIGGSNGGNLGTILKKKGRGVIDLTEKSFRIKEGTAEKLEKQIVDSMPEDMVVIFVATDSSLYFCEDEEGARYLPKKGADEKYHIEGQLKLASAKQAAKVLQKLLPLLRLLRKNKKIIMIPLPRYICLACCDDRSHCTNRKEEGFISGILEGLREIRRELKEAVGLRTQPGTRRPWRTRRPGRCQGRFPLWRLRSQGLQQQWLWLWWPQQQRI